MVSQDRHDMSHCTDGICRYRSREELEAALSDSGVSRKTIKSMSRPALIDEACRLGIVNECCRSAKPLRGLHAQAVKRGFRTKADLMAAIVQQAATNPSIDVDRVETMSKNGLVDLAQRLGIIDANEAATSSTKRHTTIKTYLYTLIKDDTIRSNLKRYVNAFSKAWNRGMWSINLEAVRRASSDLDGRCTVGDVVPSLERLDCTSLWELANDQNAVGRFFVPDGKPGTVASAPDPTSFMELDASEVSLLSGDAWAQLRTYMAKSKYLPHAELNATLHLWSRIRRHLVAHHPVLEACFGSVRGCVRPLAVGRDVWEDAMAWRRVAFDLGGSVDEGPGSSAPMAFEFSKKTLAVHAWLYLQQSHVDGIVRKRAEAEPDVAKKRPAGLKRFDLMPLSGGVGRVHAYVDVKIARCLVPGKRKASDDDLRTLFRLTAHDIKKASKEKRNSLRKRKPKKPMRRRKTKKGGTRRSYGGAGRGSVPSDETSELRSFQTDGVSMTLSYELAVLRHPHPYVGVVDKSKRASEGSVVLPDPRKADAWPLAASESKTLVSMDTGRAKLLTAAVNRIEASDRVMTDSERIEWASEAKIHMLSRRMMHRGMKQHRRRTWQDERIRRVPGLKDALEDMSKAATEAGLGYDGLKRRLESIRDHWNVLKSEYLEDVSADEYGKWKMTLFRGKRSTIDRFVRKVVGNDRSQRVEMSIGAAKFAPTGKGEQSVPTSSMLREIIRVIRVHKIAVRLNKAMDEYLTTQVCYRSGERMTKVTGRLYCCHAEACVCRPLRPSVRKGTETDSAFRLDKEGGRRRNRDVNAARNMLIVNYASIMGLERPEALRRDGPNAKVAKKRATNSRRKTEEATDAAHPNPACPEQIERTMTGT